MPKKSRKRTPKPIQKFNAYVWTPDRQCVPFSQFMEGTEYVFFYKLDAKDLLQLILNVRNTLSNEEHYLYITECEGEPDDLYDVLKRTSLWQGQLNMVEDDDGAVTKLVESLRRRR